MTGMLQSGRSLLRINTPIIIGAVFASIYFGIFGFHWAPNSALYRKQMFSSLSQNKNNHASQSTIYKNDAESRIWYLGNPPGIDSPGNPFRQVRVEQFSAPGKMKYELFADEATWDPASRTWTFRQAIKRNYSQEEPRQLHDVPVFAGQEYQTLKEHYPETPWQLISPNVRVDTQGTPALQELIKSGTTNARYLRSLQTEWHVRIARMFSCIILTFIAIPSAITFQRRSAMSASALRCSWRRPCCSCMSFPTLASAGYLPTWLGAWMPNIIYTIIAIRLFQTKLAHRSFSELLRGLKKTPVHDHS
ncbi:MAG: LptF/LptG family permease [Akkermansia sp.]